MLASYMQSALLRLDGWANEVTGLGTALLDKTVAAIFAQRAWQSDQYLGQLYENDGLARRICEKVPDEMFRAGYDLLMGKADNAQELATQIRDKLTAIGADGAIKDGLVWERVYGGGAVFIGAEDGSADPSEPLNEQTLRDITHLTVVDKPQMTARRWYPATDARAGRPETWLITPMGDGGTPIEVHESRLLIFPGGRVTQQRRIQLQGWGQSVLRAVHDVLRDYQMSWQGVSHMLQSANQDVWHMSGYRNAIAGGQSKMLEYFRARFGLAQMKMGPNQGILLDSEGERFERHGSHFTGVPETLQQLAQRMSAVTDMPMTVLFGMSPAGLNATGESDLQLWNTAVAAKQVERLEPQQKRLIRLVMLCNDGPTGGREIEGWGIRYRALKHLDEGQAGDLRGKQAAVDKTYIEMGVLFPEEVALNRFRPEGFSTETTIDLEARKKILAAEQEAARERAENPPEPPPSRGPGDGKVGEEAPGADGEDPPDDAGGQRAA
jgi:phage-related protein (TIGR01555 family)